MTSFFQIRKFWAFGPNALVLGLALVGFSSMAEAAPGTVKIRVELSPVGSFEASNNTLDGKAHIVGDTVSADSLSINTAAFDSENDLRNEHLRNRYLEVEKYPKAELKEVKGKDGKFAGKLTWRAVTKDVSGTYKIKGQEVHAEMKLKASDFSIAKISYMSVGARDDVEVEVTVPIEAEVKAKK